MTQSRRTAPRSGQPFSTARHISRRSKSNMIAELGYEKCESRNMLSASTSIDLAVFADQGFEQLILGHVADQIETAYLLQDASDLQLIQIEAGDATNTAVFQQTMGGLPVHGAYVSVLQGRQGEILSVRDRGAIFLATQDSMTPGIDLLTAQLVANDDFLGRAELTVDGQLVWFRQGDRAELAWRVETVVTGADINHSDLQFTTIVDANNGSVLSQVQTPTAIADLIYETEHAVYPRIVINDAIGASGSRTYAAPFDAIVELALGCTGTLIAPNVVISARHCGAGAGSTINFGDNSNSPVFSATVQSSSLPDGNGSLLDGGDVAILTLTGNVPGSVATPQRLIDETSGLVGQVAATLGYGLNGIGSQGHQNSSDGWRWGGENIIDVYGSPAGTSGSNIISTDFDDGTNGNNTIPSSSATPLTFEATTAPGDSGGPVMVQVASEWLIAGVLSGGTTSTSVYGDISWWTGTAIYRTEIEAAGGVFADGGLGSVAFDATTYFFGDTVGITVNDSNGVNPVNVTVVSDSGDSETLTLSNGGSGFVYTGSILTSDAGVSTGDGILQAADTDQLTVTYVDPDDGTGSSATVNDTATIHEPGNGVLVGVDFDQPGSPFPTNWQLVPGGGNATFNNLFDENGDPTLIDLAIDELSDGTWFDFAVTPDANTIPQHPNALANIDGQIYTGADPLQLTYSDLTPFADYEVYVLSAEGFFSSIEQTVTITGDGTPVSFDQNFSIDQLFVNDELGDSSRDLSSYAKIIKATGGGQIVINIDPIAGTSDVVLAGAAIFEIPVVELIDPFATKFLDGLVGGGSLADAQTSNDVYYQLNPSPTANPEKQIIDLILASEYLGGSLNSFEFYLEAAMVGGPQGDVIQTVELWNEQDSAWDLFDTRAASTTDESVVVSAGGDLARYVHPLTNEIFARVQWESPGFAGTPFSWTVNVDQFGWLIS